MTNEISSKYSEALELEVELLFLSNDSTKWQKKTTKRNEYFSSVASKRRSSRKSGSSLFFLTANTLQNDGNFHDISSPDAALCKTVSDKKEAGKILSFHHKQLLDNVLRKGITEAVTFNSKLLKPRHPHTTRRNALNGVISRLETQLAEVKRPDIRELMELSDTAQYQLLLLQIKLTLAEACYHRGRIVRPRGFSVPVKKTELYNQAKQLFDEVLAVDESNAPETQNETRKQAELGKASLYVELQAHGAQPEDFISCLQGIVTSYDVCVVTVPCILALGECGVIEDDKLKKILALQDKNLSPLDHARAALLLNDWSSTSEYLDKAIPSLDGASFFHPAWKQTVNLLKDENAVNNLTAWSEHCLNLWEIARDNEQKLLHGCHLRWYWSSQRDVYDLAFHAAGKDYELKARIADSLKGRPSMHLAQIETIKGGADKWIESQVTGLMDQYSENFKELTVKEPKKKGDMPDKEWLKLPSEWIAVHFYLSSGIMKGEKYGSTTGYALVQYPEEKGKSPALSPFDYQPIWAAYMHWQESYNKLSKKHAGKALENLCQQIGEQMSFLFDEKIIPLNQNVVFVPHDFLHRLPLHMAMNNQGGLGVTGSSLFLPVWQMPKIENKLSVSTESTLIYDTIHEISVEKLVPNEDDLPDGTIKIPCRESENTENALLKLTNQKKLLIIAHGTAHPLNPFLSKLELGEAGVSLQGILQSEMDLSGATVGLVACETDLAPFSAKTLDEHFTISSALLFKNAEFILGALWETDSSKAKELLINDWFMKTDSINAVMEKFLKKELIVYRQQLRANSEERWKTLYDFAAFRLFGQPINTDN